MAKPYDSLTVMEFYSIHQYITIYNNCLEWSTTKTNDKNTIA